jgi:hypothetical protein
MKKFNIFFSISVALKTILFLLSWATIFPQTQMEIYLWSGIISTGILMVYYVFLFRKISNGEKYAGFFMLLLSFMADLFFYFLFAVTTGIQHLFDFSSWA